ncbi:MAG: DUF72 domain-containing protein [Deltaproteobacteria bacterium]|jgi:uncharacterized protein YecE (DUF72 family)
MKNQKNIYVGTSGWHYRHWSGPFYPEDLPAADKLEFYAGFFRTVEINNSFYQLPKEETLARWHDITQADFIFSLKASRYITHMKKLKDGDKTFQPLAETVKVLEPKLGPILFQLPPNWGFNPERLEAFLKALPPDYRYVFEFRHPGWFTGPTYEILQRFGAAFCIYELAGLVSPKKITAEFVYVRLHGPGKAYQGQYDTRILAGWAGAFSTWAGQGKDIFCYFDNDQLGYAVQDALKLQHMIRGRA